MAKLKVDDEYVRTCPETLPEGLTAWIDDVVLPEDQTIIYARGNKKGYCSVCGNEITALPGRKFIQSSYAQCPSCGRDCICYLEDGTLWKSIFIDNIAAVQKAEDGSIWIRQWHLLRGYHRRPNYLHDLQEIARYCLTPGDSPQAAKWVHEKKESWFFRCDRYRTPDWKRNKKTVDIYDGFYKFYFPEGAEDMFQGTALHYIKRDSILNSTNPIRAIMDYGRYPALEKLYNAGYHMICKEIVRGNGKGIINKNAKTVNGALKVPLWVLKMKDPEKWYIADVKRCQEAYRLYKEGRIHKEGIRILFETHLELKYIELAIGYAPIKRILEYVESLKRQQTEVQRPFKSHPNAYEYRDYLEMAERCGLDLKNKRVLFPKDLIKEHDKLVGRVKAAENKELSQKITEVSKKLEKYDYTLADLLIRPARSWRELYEEGKRNNHCVETYSKRMASGETAIFFVRRSEDPESTYFTLELRDKKVIQCRTKNNVSYEQFPEVKRFVEEWYQTKVLKRKAAV